MPPLLAQLPPRCVLDGEIVIARDGALDFEALQLRLHPAASRVKLLSREIPASIVFFDLLALGDRDLRDAPFAERRAELERILDGRSPAAPCHAGDPRPRDRRGLVPALRGRRASTASWRSRPRDATSPTSASCSRSSTSANAIASSPASAGTRGREQTAVGSLLLGLYDDAGALQHVGVCGSFTAAKRKELVEFLAPYRANDLADHPWKEWAACRADAGDDPHARAPSSRWSQGKDLSWEPLRPELVVEVAYDHMQSGRFRHTAQFRRWRPDKRPRDCTFAQLEVVAPEELAEIFGAGIELCPRGEASRSGPGVMTPVRSARAKIVEIA